MRNTSFIRIKDVVILIGIIGFGIAVCALAQAQTTRGGYQGARTQNRGEYRGYTKGQDQGVTRYSRDRDEFSDCRKKYLGKPGIPSEVYAACVDAITDAKSIASRVATAFGCEDGYYTGLAQGLWDGADSFANDNVSYLDGREAATNALNTDPGLKDAAASAYTHGANRGDNDAASDVRTLWVKAVDRGLPAPLAAPKSDLEFTDSPFNSPYGAYGAFYPAPLSLEQMAMNEQYDASNLRLYNERNRHSRICNDCEFIRPKNGFRVKDYYSKDGRYQLDRNRAIDGKDAFDGFVNGRYRDASSRGNARYNQLKGKTITVQAAGQSSADTTAPKPSDASPGNKPLGNRGVSGNGNGQRPTAAPIVYSLEEIYKTNFITSYSYYAEKFYSDGFYDMRDDGYDDGYWIGANIGRNYSGQQGFVSSFNTGFRNLERNAYNDGYRQGYASAYANEYTRYRTAPVISAELIDVVDLVDDGILQPGESTYAIYSIKNYGGVAGDLQVQLQGAGIQSSSSSSIQIPAMSSKRFEDTRLVGVINPDLKSLSAAEIYLSVTGGDQPQLSPISRSVTHQVTLEGTAYETETAAGVVKVKVSLLNRSPKIPTTDDVKVVVSDNNGRRVEKNLGRLKASELVNPEPIDVTGYRPLDVYQNKITYVVQVSIGDKVVATSQGIRVQEAPDKAHIDLVAIFDKTAQKAETQADALAALDQLIAEVTEEVKLIGNNTYKDSPAGTLLYTVMGTFRAHPQSAAAKTLYSEFASKIRPLDRNLNAAIHFRKSRGRKQFLAWMDELGGK